MELSEALLKRRSCRKFKDTLVKEEDITSILHAAMSGPSACNSRPWKFVVVSNEDKLKQLRHATPYSNIKAPLAIIVVGYHSRFLPMQLAPYWIEDCSAATENILLKATDLGLGSLWCGVYPQERNVQHVQKILDIDEKDIPLNIIYIGYPDIENEPRDQYTEKAVLFIK